MNSLVSVIIPTFNNRNTIIETINSVEKQSYKNIEIIIIDDGSTDNVKKVIFDYKCISLIPISYCYQKNSGPSAARNLGAKISKGEYLLFLDADDLISEYYIEKSVNILHNNNNVNIVYADANFFEAKEGKWNLPDYNLTNFLRYNCIPIFAIIRRDVFIKVEGFDEKLKFTEDWDLWIKIVKHFGGVYKIPETMYYYRQRHDKTSLSDNKHINNNSDLSRLYIYNKHYDFYCANNLDLTSLIDNTYHLENLKIKYQNIWYKKIFSKIKGKK